MKKYSVMALVIFLYACQTGYDSTNANFQSANDYADPVPELDLRALQWRFIGPIVGNRGSVVLGHPTQPDVFFFGASNGLWKTEDAGTYWMPVGDKDFKLSFMSGILDHSEGPVTNTMKAEFREVLEQAKEADQNYNASITPELAKLEELMQ